MEESAVEAVGLQAAQSFMALLAQQVQTLRREVVREAGREAEGTIAPLRAENARLRAEVARTYSVGNPMSAAGAGPDAVLAWQSEDDIDKHESSDLVDMSMPRDEPEVLELGDVATPPAPKSKKLERRTVPVCWQSEERAPPRRAGQVSLARFSKDVHKDVERFHGGGLFADAAVMKEQIRNAINKPSYNVSDLYWEAGYCQKIARNHWFETITLCMIAINGVWIAVDSDYNGAPTLLQADPLFQVVDHTFCAFFVLEWAVRFGAFRTKLSGLRDSWFVFDSVLACSMVLDTWLLTIVFAMMPGHSNHGAAGDTSALKLLRLFRLTRIARMAKLLHAVPELMVLIKGLAVAARSVFCTLVLLVFIVYIFALAFKQLCDGTTLGEQRFDSVLEAMRTLFLDATLPDFSSIVSEAGEEHICYSFLLLAFILLGTLTVMNMLVGVLVEVVKVVSCVENEQLMVDFVKTKLQTLYNGVEGKNNTISRFEFEKLLVRPEAAKVLQEVGVDVVGLVDLADVIFQETDELLFPDFMGLVLQFRGTNNATVRDIVYLRKFISQVAKFTKESSCDTVSHEELVRIDAIHAERAEAIRALEAAVKSGKVEELQEALNNATRRASLGGEHTQAASLGPRPGILVKVL